MQRCFSSGDDDGDGGGCGGDDDGGIEDQSMIFSGNFSGEAGDDCDGWGIVAYKSSMAQRR